MTPTNLANLARYIILSNLRRQPMSVCFLIGGYDEENDEMVLFWLDEIGSLQKLPFAVHAGVELPFLVSLLDSKDRQIKNKFYDLGVEGIEEENELLALIKDCWEVLQSRSLQRLDYQDCVETICISKPRLIKNLQSINLSSR